MWARVGKGAEKSDVNVRCSCQRQVRYPAAAYKSITVGAQRRGSSNIDASYVLVANSAPKTAGNVHLTASTSFPESAVKGKERE